MDTRIETSNSNDPHGSRVQSNVNAGMNPAFDPQYLLGVLMNRYKPILGVVLLSLLMGGLYLSFQKNEYTATAMIQLNTNQPPLLDSQAVVLGRFEDSAAVQSELDVLKSPGLIRRVVKKLDLASKGEFNGALQPPTFVSRIRKMVSGGGTSTPGSDHEEVTQIQVTNNVLQHLSIRKDPLSYSVYISFTSRIPNRARVIANAIADEYLAFQIEAGNDNSRHAREWYTKRIAELRQNVIASERAVQEYSQEHNLFELDGKTLDDQQVSDLNAQLAAARAELAQAGARYDRASQLVKSPGGIESVKEVLSSVLIASLREKEAELLREKSELSGHYGAMHPKMLQINREITDLRGKIGMEIQKIMAGMENEVVIARARAESLAGQLESMRSGMGDETRVQLTELKREAEANRILYESFLAKSKETREAENIDQAKARIISRADLPLRAAYPKKSLVAAFFLVGGLFCGIALAFLMELLNVGFTTPEQVEEHLGVTNIGMVPEVVGSDAGSHYVTQHPASIYASALRSVMASLKFSDAEKPPKSLLIISSLPQEGKGWLSVSLARLAARSGKKVLLLDCDLHRPMDSETFNIYPRYTLNDYLKDKCRIGEALNIDQATGMHYIVSSPAHGNAQELLESGRMKQLMEFAHTAYDLIIVDSPPVIGMADVLFLSQLVDTAVLAVRWGRTPRRVVGNALRILSRARIRLAGTVLTRVDLNEYKKSEFGSSYFYSHYSGYFQEEKPAAAASFAGNLKEKIVKFRARA